MGYMFLLEEQGREKMNNFCGRYSLNFRLLCFYMVLTVLVCPLRAIAGVDDDNEIVIELASQGTSEVYKRPAEAEYFWWDTDPKVQVELVFEDGSKKITGSEDTFRKRIASVTFINPDSQAHQIKLWSRE